MKLSTAQYKTLQLLAEGWKLNWEQDEPSWPSSCALWKGGGFRRVHPATLKALERRGLIELPPGRTTATITATGKNELAQHEGG